MTTRDPLDPMANLELLSAACKLAPQLYSARGEVYNVDGVWTLLSAADRQGYIDRCIALLQSVAPLMGTVVAFPENR